MPEFETQPCDRERPEEPDHEILKHKLKYSIWSSRVSWCPICKEHFYNSRNKKHTTKATCEHYHII